MKLGTGFDRIAGNLRWQPIDDRVMGGVSMSSVETAENGSSVFKGIVSKQYGGGFASVRATTPGLNLDGYAGLILRVKGDGKIYKINLKNSSEFDGAVFQSSFAAPADEWLEIRLPFSSFKASFRGMMLAQSIALDPGEIDSIGIMISEKQTGEFRLEIESLECY